MSTDIDFRFDDVELEKPEVPALEPAKEPTEEEVEEDQKYKNELLAIYDAVMFEDKYEERVSLGRKYYAIFITRPAESDALVSRQIDNMDFKTVHAMRTHSAILTLSHSLVELNGKDLRDMEAKDRYDLVKGKSTHLIEMLSRHLIDFDQKVREAMEYGEANF